MKEMNLIGFLQADYPATVSVAMLPAQNSRDIAAIVGAVQTKNALTLHSAAEHNPVGAGEKGGSEDDFFHARQLGCNGFGQKITSL